MSKTYCKICGKETKYFIVCSKEAGLICMDHCPGCKYFAGRDTWNCRYKGKVKRNTRGEKDVTDFRNKMEEIKNRTSAKKQKSQT